MPRRKRGLHDDSNDPEAAPGLGGRRSARRAPHPALPPSFFGTRALFVILRLGSKGEPIRLTFIGARRASEERLEAALRTAAMHVERRAPGVYDVELHGDRLESLVLEHRELLRRVDAPGWVHGEVVTDPSDRAEVTVEMDEPLTPVRKGDLGRMGFHLVGESAGELRGVVLGRDLAGLTDAPWLGPIEVRKVHPQKG